MKSSKKILFPLCIIAFFFHSCTIIVTEGMRKQINDYSKLMDSSYYFVPETQNHPNSVAMVGIDDIKTKLIYDLRDTLSDSSRNKFNNSRSEISSNEKNKIDSIEKIVEKYEISTKLTGVDATHYPDSIKFTLTVTDNKGNFISGLAEPYLSDDKKQSNYWKKLVDSCNGIQTNIDEFKVREVRQSSSPKYAICYVLDHSNSMGTERILTLQQSVRYTIGKVKEDDILSVLKFATEPLLEVKPTSDHNEFIKNFKMDGKTLGGTDILRALDSAGKILSAIPEEYTRIILLFTDGVSSMVSYRRVIGGLYKNKIRVFGICYGMVNFEPIKKISQDTDGQLLLLRNVKDFAAAFQHIYNTLTNYYEVTYYPPSCYNLHNFQLNISLAELEYEHLKINGDYDVSILSNFAEEGTKVMSDISFEYGKSVISDSGLVKIVDIAEQLKRNSAVKILVIGHTDDIGGDEYNMKLSKDRAESVKKELIRLGIPANRLQATGKGKNDPLVPNDSNENRKQNRRTEFVVVE